MTRLAIYGPLLLFAVFVVFVGSQLGRETRVTVTSKLIGQPMPAVNLPGLGGAPGLTSADFKTGKPVLVNVFASWCIPCRVEAPQLARLTAMGVTVNGIAVRDAPDDVAAFLKTNGNPFTRVGLDKTGQTQITLGSSGVPETFVIDGRGIIRYQHIGEIRPEHIALLMAKLTEAGR
ncbi:DsbE family thiol:disulfide interchange protein [Polymorphobacter arshaanensis]|uniref:DsbE family thiol:disulfide interchange protein n=1 Tax=Glacieibacterium arshaanense TaxID=2511025 RepID=A0A4Y9ELT7_9SPHN|nr:DsbE family thiol:disulfide interchange protein [Polymorphobacter arshaanensis]